MPLAVLTLSLRRWRPLPYARSRFALALSWNVTPLAYSFRAHAPTTRPPRPHYWQPVVGYLHHALTPDYRVEVVDTAGHWDAVYLPAARIPIVRGWFRQDDFPQNELLYDKLDAARVPRLAPPAQRPLRRPDGRAARLQRRARPSSCASGRSGLPVVFRSRRHRLLGPVAEADRHRPRPAAGEALTESTVTLRLSRPGTYHLGIRYTPYLRSPLGCVSESKDGMTVLTAPQAGTVKLAFSVSTRGALAALTGRKTTCSKP